MEKYELKKDDMYKNYFHFTSQSNIKGIQKQGLIPNIGRNARYIEKTKKVFFVEGLDNLLILFDCWINCWIYIPRFTPIYFLGANLICKKWFPQFISDAYFKILKKSRLYEESAYQIFDRILDDGILLNLDIKENIDFKYDDIDEIKAKGYKKRHLELMGYSKKYSSLESACMDKWNLHCLSNHTISVDKIKLCFINKDDDSLRSIFNFALENTKIDIEDVCPVLWGYLNWLNEKN